MKVLISGVSSFTGSHIGRAFVEAGYEVAATLTQSLESYNNPLQKERLEFSKISHFYEHSAFGSDNFLKT
jgi:nucleoside-diphosphate-sugar epimerase